MIKVSCPNCMEEFEVNVSSYDEDLSLVVECTYCGLDASMFCFDYVGGNVEEEK